MSVSLRGALVDLNAAYALYLRNVQHEGAFYELADARVPANMRGLFENGDRGSDAAREAVDYVTKAGVGTGPSGESLRFQKNEVKIKAPLIPKKFFHTAGNFRGHHEEAQKSGFSPSRFALDRFFSKRGRHHRSRRSHSFTPSI